MINARVIAFILGILLMIEGGFMLISVPVTIIYGDEDAFPILQASLITCLSGFILWILFRKCGKEVGRREGYIVVTLGWILFSFFGALPFTMSHAIPLFTDAYFETMSGFTTTGASILNDVESLSHGLLFWRSLTQWLGGMGIIVLSLVVLPILGIGGMQLFAAEVPGPIVDKLHPRIRETAKRLWGLYTIITLAQVLLLILGGMSVFDSVCHSFSTLATGGYSTKQTSVGYYTSPYIHYVFIFFMVVAGINFSLVYLGMRFQFKKIWQNEEFRGYLSIILLFSAVITIFLYCTTNGSLEKSFCDATFQVVSFITTTGFATTDYVKWLPPGYILLLLLMFVGGSSGSTGGSIKVIRIMLMLKSGFLELKRIIHPNAIIPVRMDKEAVRPEVLVGVLAFITVYIIITVIASVIVSFLGYDMETSVSAVAATLGNIGPGLGQIGTMNNYEHFNQFGKWFFSFLMLIGRLELFTVLVLFTPTFWKR